MTNMDPLFYIEDSKGWPYLAVTEYETNGLVQYVRLRDEGDRPAGTAGTMNTLHLNGLIKRGVADVTHIGGRR